MFFIGKNNYQNYTNENLQRTTNRSKYTGNKLDTYTVRAHIKYKSDLNKKMKNKKCVQASLEHVIEAVLGGSGLLYKIWPVNDFFKRRALYHFKVQEFGNLDSICHY